MKKKLLIIIAMIFTMATASKAQLYAPGYANYAGIGYFTLPNGYYYGQIYAGYPQGEGYYYFVDPQLGAVFYHGYFDKGLCNGLGEVVSNSGYIYGTWDHGEFVSQTYVQPQQMQQSYYNVWSNYWNYFASVSSYTLSYSWDWNYYSYPVYNNSYAYPNYSYPNYNYYSYPSYTQNSNSTSNNYQASNDVKIPANTKITQIDSDTQLGRQLLGKIKK